VLVVLLIFLGKPANGDKSPFDHQGDEAQRQKCTNTFVNKLDCHIENFFKALFLLVVGIYQLLGWLLLDLAVEREQVLLSFVDQPQYARQDLLELLS
jgi:hypothetical protein